MFVAIDLQTQERFVSLDAKWRIDLHELRALGKSDRLGCPECRQPVSVRQPEARRRHFFHKHRGSCPLHDESAELVEARAVLYEWLVGRAPGRVRIEHRPEGGDALPRPIDLYVEPANEHREVASAIWIFDAPMRDVAVREAIKEHFTRNRVPVSWIFESAVLREGGAGSGSLLLTKMERDFSVRTEFDRVEPDNLGSLHYLNSLERTLTTFRRVRAVHAPNVHKGEKLVSPLDELLVCEADCEVEHPHERIQFEALVDEYRRKHERHAREIAEIERMSREREQRRVMPPRPPVAKVEPFLAVPSPPQPKTIRCTRCGEMKTEAECAIYKRVKREGTCKPCMRRDDGR